MKCHKENTLDTYKESVFFTVHEKAQSESLKPYTTSLMICCTLEVHTYDRDICHATISIKKQLSKWRKVAFCALCVSMPGDWHTKKRFDIERRQAKKNKRFDLFLLLSSFAICFNFLQEERRRRNVRSTLDTIE